MADRFKRLAGEVRANALWDVIKWIILLGVAAMSFSLPRLIGFLMGMPQSVLLNLIVFLMGLALVIVAWIVGYRKNKKKLQVIHNELDATYNKEITELRQQLAESNETLETDAKTIEQYRAQVERLGRNLETQHVGFEFREQALNNLKAQYGFLHEMAAKHAKEISEHVQVHDYFAIYQRLAESVPRIYLGFDVYNKSVFDIVIEPEIAGYIRLDGDVNLRKPETIHSVHISHLSYARLVIDQHLSPEQFDLIAKRENEKDGASFYFNKLSVMFKIATPFFETDPIRLEVPQVLSSKAVKNRVAIELNQTKKHASNIEKLTLALGSCYLAYKQIRRGELLPEADYQTLKSDIGFALDSCFGKDAGNEFFSQQTPFPSTLEEQDKWVDLQCKNLRELIEKEKE